MRGTFNHVDLTVTDPDRSLPPYEAVVGYKGCRNSRSHARGCDFDRDTIDGVGASVGIVRTQDQRRTRRHDQYSPGLHHIAWTTPSRGDVDGMHRLLLELEPTSQTLRPTTLSMRSGTMPSALPIQTV